LILNRSEAENVKLLQLVVEPEVVVRAHFIIPEDRDGYTVSKA
jgi:hypothetical protein